MMNDRGRRLLWHGMLLFALGLVTGLVSQLFVNPRMGLSSHLEGLMNGTFLVAVGATWHQVHLSSLASTVAFRAALYGTYANWVTTTLAAAFGTAAMTPLASGTHTGLPWQEAVVTLGFGSVALAMLTAAIVLLTGFRGASGGPSSAQ